MATKLKYLLIPLLLIQGSYSVQAQGFFQDLFTVEGIQFRYGGIGGTQDITIDNASLTSESKAADGYKTINSVNAGLYLPLVGATQTVRLPYTFVFKEKLMNSWSFRGPYFDFASGSILDIPVKDTSATDPRDLTEEIDNATKNQVTTIKWFDRSADLHRTVLMVGYRWGVFYPSSQLNRWMKFGFGFGGGWGDFRVELNDCKHDDGYVVSIGKKIHTGKCKYKELSETVSGNGLTYSTNILVVLYERVTPDYKLAFFSSDQSSVNISGLKLKNGNELKISSYISNFDVLSYTYLF